MSTNYSTLVLALGNQLRGDDGIGVAVANELGLAAIPSLTLRRSHAGIAAEVIDKAWHTLIVIDAEAMPCSASEAKAPGDISLYDLHRDRLPPPPSPMSSHGINLSQEIALLRELNALPQNAKLITIVGQSFAPTTALSPIVAMAIPGAVQKIISLLQDIT